MEYRLHGVVTLRRNTTLRPVGFQFATLLKLMRSVPSSPQRPPPMRSAPLTLIVVELSVRVGMLMASDEPVAPVMEKMGDAETVSSVLLVMFHVGPAKMSVLPDWKVVVEVGVKVTVLSNVTGPVKSGAG